MFKMMLEFELVVLNEMFQDFMIKQKKTNTLVGSVERGKKDYKECS